MFILLRGWLYYMCWWEDVFSSIKNKFINILCFAVILVIRWPITYSYNYHNNINNAYLGRTHNKQITHLDALDLKLKKSKFIDVSDSLLFDLIHDYLSFSNMLLCHHHLVHYNYNHQRALYVYLWNAYYVG